VSSIGDTETAGALELDAGETITCTFTNTKRGNIIVVKQTDPDGSTVQFEFNPSWSGTNFFLVDGGSEDSGLMVPGMYSVSEIVPSGWTLSSATCDDGSPVSAIDLDPGETVTCTFYNTQQIWAFTPGFWKNHTAASPSGHNAWPYTDYDPGDLLIDVGFVLYDLGGEYPKGSDGTFSTLTLLEALRLKGGAGYTGAGEILLRAGVASLLNASFHEVMQPTEPFLAFPLSSAEVIDAVNTAIATGDPGTMLELAAILDGYNNGYEYFDWTWPVP
jgi:hypothetical protein